jgi:DNA polymerase III delta prime subunit
LKDTFLVGVEHNKIMTNIANRIVVGSMHHSVILSGSYGIGKQTLAISIIKKIIALDKNIELKNANNLTEFDFDDKDVNLIDKSTHPDLLYLSSKSELKKNITVDQVREISKFINVSPSRLKYKFIIIDAIDHLNDYAVNALLKNLEEPSQNCFFFLISHKQLILQTINSRCLVYNVPNLNDIEMELLLSAKNVENESELKEMIDSFSFSFGCASEMLSNGLYSVYKLMLAKIGNKKYDYDIKNAKFESKIILISLVNRLIKILCQGKYQNLIAEEKEFIGLLKIDKLKISKLLNKQNEWVDLINNGEIYNSNSSDLINAICSDIGNILK